MPFSSRVKPWVTYRLVGGAAAGAAGLQHRGVEPAAMLVGALQIHVRRPYPVRPVAQREGVGACLSLNQTSRMSVTFSHSSCGWSLARKRALAFSSNQALAPSVLEGRLDPGVHGGVAEDVGGAVGSAPDEAGQRHAPGALARQHPVGAGLDHRVEPVAAGLRVPGDQPVDRGQRPLADGAGRTRPCRRRAGGRSPRTTATCCGR